MNEEVAVMGGEHWGKGKHASAFQRERPNAEDISLETEVPEGPRRRGFCRRRKA